MSTSNTSLVCLPHTLLHHWQGFEAPLEYRVVEVDADEDGYVFDDTYMANVWGIIANLRAGKKKASSAAG